jgi:hypothetical protein
MSKALEAAHEAYATFGQTGGLRTQQMSDEHLRAIITAFLDAAAEDEAVAANVGQACTVRGAATYSHLGQAAILALKEAVNAG